MGTQPHATPEQIELATLAKVRGTVLEIGAGTGANFDDLPKEITWIGLEPKQSSLPDLRRNAREFSPDFRVIKGVAESIPLDDDSVDTVLSTFVLCSVDDADQVLREVRRVLRPGGQFVFLEHVGAPARTFTRGLQRASAVLSGRRQPGDCDPLRDTLASIEAAGFARVEAEAYRVPVGFGVRMPHVAGVAS